MKKIFAIFILSCLIFGLNFGENLANSKKNSTNSNLNSTQNSANLTKHSLNPNANSSNSAPQNQVFALVNYDESLLENGSLQGYVVSEKLDGVRALWDGKVLKSRSGKAFAAPSCWLKHLPPFALDGELYTGRGEFERLLSIVNKANASCEAWQSVNYHIFDAPNASGTLIQRLNVVQNYAKSLTQPHPLRIIEQRQIASKAELATLLEQVSKNGGEGLVIRKNAAPYESFRTSNAMKLKAYEDAECKVVAHHEGKGRLAGKFGSLTCEQEINSPALKQDFSPDLRQDFSPNLKQNASSPSTANKDLNDTKRVIRFKIGSGFSDKERENPPPLGSFITYKFNGYTAKGLPKFPVFLRIYQPQ